MAVFKFVISESGISYQVEKDQKDCPVFNKKIGDSISGDFLGLEGSELLITGGSDKDGFPMKKDIEGSVKKRAILTKGVGFHTNKEGTRKRKMIIGNTINADVVQINCKITKQGQKTAEELFAKKVEEKKE